MLATNPIPQASCSCRGSYRPWAGGRPFFGFRRVVMDLVRWTKFLSNHSFLGAASEGDGLSHTSAQGTDVYILVPAEEQVQCRISMQLMQISGHITMRRITR